MADSQMFVGPFIHSISVNNLEINESAAIIVGADGKIQEVVKSVENIAKLQQRFSVADANVHVLNKGQFIIPGFIDTHIHAAQYPNAGLGYDMPLLDWLDTYTYPLEKRFSDTAFARRVYEAVVKNTLANGSTTCCYYATIHLESSLLLADLVASYGQRAFVGKINMNMNTPDGYGETTEESVAATETFITEVQAKKNPLVQPIITPRFALSCDMDLMQRLAALARKYKVHIQSHISENQTEVEIAHQLYPEAANYVDIYDRAGLVTDKTILAHGVFLTPVEEQVLANKKTSLAHCPNSNTMLQSGLFCARNLLKSGVKLGLGTDCSGGYSCSILQNMRDALQVSIHTSFIGKGDKLSLAEAFHLATLGGAKALSIDNTTGNFIVGKDFDALLVNLNGHPALDLIEEYNLDQILQKFIYLGDDRYIEKVFVAGRQVK